MIDFLFFSFYEIKNLQNDKKSICKKLKKCIYSSVMLKK